MAQTATTSLTAPLPNPSLAWVDPATGRPTQVIFQYFALLDQIMRAAQFGKLINAANDAAAAAAGVPVGALYRTTNAVQVRLV